MNISLEQRLQQLVPNMKVGTIHYRNLTINESPQMLLGRLQTFQELLYFDLVDNALTERAGIAHWRRYFKQLGIDASRYRPSHEAMMRRVQKHQFVEGLHSAVDLNNLFSLTYETPIGIYDVEKLQGDVTIRIDGAGEYEALNGRSFTATGKLASFDEVGPFGSPIVDSKRTAMTTNTTEALQLVYLHEAIEAPTTAINALAQSFINVHGGEIVAQTIL